MWRNIMIIGLLIALSSCGAKRKGVDASKESKEVVLGNIEAVSYKSLGNGVASISLKLFENNTFKFDFKSIPQPDTEEKPIVISEKGTYTSEGNWKILNFKNPKFSLAAIFDKNFSGAADFRVIDETNVKINTSKNVLPIWGVVCEKQ
ncbi:hypothetical protein [Aequorivita lipolytica]|jgi:hypothetical protein|uniref:Lipoprotein n=1 Tax=Aequorivita lipolytica TaxID=153267 RepID=A0A5C6YPT4_9FLAO|nr:hypothetical protein [Aequorivita lipolytica]TXD68896.1 hypothetical protein ESV24_10615 [Aequorivita lipolytica]SRX52156.1 hypothetical protein AEQU2_02135 [Aequorivita lipolytica]